MRQIIGYSDAERDLIALLPKSGKPLNTLELVKRYYDGSPPFNAREIILGRLGGIMRKAEANREAWRIVKSPRRGPHPVEFLWKSGGSLT